jgi:Mn2+/Fe2+ NRAMP family transporter
MSSADLPQPPVAIPEPSGVLAEPWSLGKVWRLAVLFGPAAIVASVSIGAGETIVVVRAGSWAGYDLLWLIVASTLVKGVCATYLLGRYTAVSGEMIGARLVRLPGPRGWLLLAIVGLELAAAGPLWAAIARPCGDLMYFLLERAVVVTGLSGAAVDATGQPAAALFGISALTWQALFATFVILAALGFGAGVSFASLERQQVIICCVLVGGTILGTVMVWPDFVAALIGCVHVGHVPPIPNWAPPDVRQQPLLTMVTTFGYVGGSVMCYIAYANWISKHGWGLCGHADIRTIRERAAAGRPGDYLPSDPAEAARLRRLIAPLKWDVALGASVLFVVSASFMMAGAAVLYPRLGSGELMSAFEGWSLLTDQGQIWQSIHPALVWVYYVCVLAALWGTLQAYPEIYARVTHEFASAIWPNAAISYRWLQWVIFAYVAATAVPLVWINVTFATLTAVVSFLATTCGVALAMLGALYLNFQLPPLYRTRWWMLAAGIVSAAILVAVSFISGRELMKSLWTETG